MQSGGDFGASETSNKFGDGCSSAQPTHSVTREPATAAPKKKPTTAPTPKPLKKTGTPTIRIPSRLTYHKNGRW